MTIFLLQKIVLSWKESATRFLCAKTVSNSVVRYRLAYLTVHKQLVLIFPST